MTTFERFGLRWSRVPGALPAERAVVDAGQLVAICRHVREHDGRLVALWGEDRRDAVGGDWVYVVLDCGGLLRILEHPVSQETSSYPDLSGLFPSASRLQRAAYDLSGIRADGGDGRPWLRHDRWPADWFPLRADFGPVTTPDHGTSYPFVQVEGDGVHEIAVGPVHAGTIEPGHFRFSVVGEKVLRLEERLGYVHKGIEKRLEGMSLAEGIRVAARVSGDSTVAFAWAYAMAAESLTETTVPPRGRALRALLLERERLANHLGDLGALGNDAGLGLGLAQFLRLKEDVLRVNTQVWAARYPMDALVPGGVRADLTPLGAQALMACMDRLEGELRVLREIYDNHAGLQDRFLGAGTVTPALARRLGIVGLAARASGQPADWRASMRMPPYDELNVTPVVREPGDVAARVAVRFEEAFDSLRMSRRLLATMPDGPIGTPLEPVTSDRLGVGGVEGWRGPVFVALRAASDGTLLRCHPHDPSWHNWPALEHAIIDNIVPDFPLINKSFNLSYSGHDL